MIATRLTNAPIIDPHTPGWEQSAIGFNINGPSLIRVPSWIERPLGQYYLYFAHHQGLSIRLAYADSPAGPWTIHTPGTLQINQTPFENHIASPDVHLREDTGELVMVYHGDGGITPAPGVEQAAAVAVSRDGLDWTHRRVLPAESYLRAFDLEGRRFGVSKQGKLYEAAAGTFDFERRVGCLDLSGRHWAVAVRDNKADFFYSRFGDAPEHILQFSVSGIDGLYRWHEADRSSVLMPQHAWEGADQPCLPSRVGSVHEPVCQLRDPAVFTDLDGQRYLVYSVAGEAGLGIAALSS